MSAPSLAEKVTAIHRALAPIPHAFGGALALAYYAEPRATIAIDVNLFVPPSRFEDVAGPLRSLGVSIDDSAGALVGQDGQVRVWWDATPVDLFFAYDPFHEAAARGCRTVPFADGEIPILGPEHLMVCKAIFNRAKDWVDLDAMRELGHGVDTAEVLRWVARIAGDEDPRFARIAALLTT